MAANNSILTTSKGKMKPYAVVLSICVPISLILGAALLAVTSLKIFRSAIWLLFSLVGIAALYFWMQVEFIAAIQIVVYVGGIVVLIIFSIFLTQQSGKEMAKPAINIPITDKEETAEIYKTPILISQI